MPLQGNLSQFALRDVLRLIESGQRTGRLLLRRGSLRAAIYFASGQWMLAQRIGLSQALSQQLVQAGLFTPDDFEELIGISFGQTAQLPDRDLVRMVLSMRLLTQEQLRAWAVGDATALLNVILHWPDGDFLFEDGVPVPDGAFALPLPVGALLAHAARGERPNGSSSRERSPLSPEAIINFVEIGVDADATIQLTREQWQILTCVDGQRPLWAIAEALNAPQPAIVQVASSLLGKGIVEVVGRA